MSYITTTDLSCFGIRERDLAIDLLKAWNDRGLPSDFHYDEVTLMFNANSGYVFLTNEDLQVVMITDAGEIELWYECLECGNEGFLEDFTNESKDCCEYINNL